MNLFKRAAMVTTGAVVLGLASLTSFGSVSADCYQYTATGTMQTSATPVFNNFCNAPYGVGAEAQFVRIRENTNGIDTDNQNNPVFQNGLTTTCTNGEKFDVWNYLHNNASQNYNPDTNPSNPTAVAKDVQENLTAQLGNGSKFTFGDTVTAANATSVSASTTLDCNGKQVTLSLVPGSVNIYSPAYAKWINISNTSSSNTGPINQGAYKVGSPVFGSGEQWGCWNYRMVIVYQLTATVKTTTPTTTPTPTPKPTSTPTPTPTPVHTVAATTLVNTGPGSTDLAIVFASVALVGGLGYRRFIAGRIAK